MLRLSLFLSLLLATTAFHIAPPATAITTTRTTTATATTRQSPLFAATSSTEKGYTPKWKKKETLDGADGDDASKGLIGNVPVIFKQGNVTLNTMALVGQPLSDVASQAGQFIKYACKKGECGTCECMVDGKWVRPCVTTVPPVESGKLLVVQLKELSAKGTSSGKFYSIKSFFMGFYNNILGMIGFVRMRRQAKKNWDERIEYEDLIRIKTEEKRAARLATGLTP